MTGFGDMIYERGIKEGKREGRQEGMIMGILMSGRTAKETAEMLKISLEEVEKIQQELLMK